MSAHNLPLCPKCNQTDQIEKVTSIYGANTKEWYETHSRTDFHGFSESYREFHEAHTQLGLKLMPPQQPAEPAHPGIWYALGGLAAFILLSAMCPLAFAPLSLFIPLFAASPFVPKVSGVPDWKILAIASGAGLLCVGLVVLGLIVWLGFAIKRRFDRDMSNYRNKKFLYDRDELPPWQHAKERWEQLYYCMRDDTVFIPAEKKAIHADDMVKYLYDPLFRSAS